MHGTLSVVCVYAAYSCKHNYVSAENSSYVKPGRPAVVSFLHVFLWFFLQLLLILPSLNSSTVRIVARTCINPIKLLLQKLK
jgi:hypothetical protein